MSTFWRIHFLQLSAYLLIVVLGYTLTFYQQHHGSARNNQWLYNISMTVEMILLSIAALQMTRNRPIVLSLFFIFIGIFSANLVICGPLVFAQYGYIAAGLIITVVYCLVLYTCVSRFKTTSEQLPYICLCAGLIIYFACTVPYFSLIHFLTRNFPQLSKMLFDIITDVLANFRYLCLGLAFWLIGHRSVLHSKALQ